MPALGPWGHAWLGSLGACLPWVPGGMPALGPWGHACLGSLGSWGPGLRMELKGVYKCKYFSTKSAK